MKNEVTLYLASHGGEIAYRLFPDEESAEAALAKSFTEETGYAPDNLPEDFNGSFSPDHATYHDNDGWDHGWSVVTLTEEEIARTRGKE